MKLHIDSAQYLMCNLHRNIQDSSWHMSDLHLMNKFQTGSTQRIYQKLFSPMHSRMVMRGNLNKIKIYEAHICGSSYHRMYDKLNSMGKLDRLIFTCDATLSKIVSIIARSCRTNLNALISWRVSIVENGRLPWTFFIKRWLQLTQALLKGSQYREPEHMEWTYVMRAAQTKRTACIL